jgi:hypothetical protein
MGQVLVILLSYKKKIPLTARECSTHKKTKIEKEKNVNVSFINAFKSGKYC